MISRIRLVAAAVGICLIVPGAAHAASIFYKGKGTDDRNVRVAFEVKGPERNGHIRFGDAKVVGFTIGGARMTINCTGQPERTASAGTFRFKDIKMKGDGDFERTEDAQTGRIAEGDKTVKGQFHRRDGEFVGSFEMMEVETIPIFDGGGSCIYDTGKIHWKAGKI